MEARKRKGKWVELVSRGLEGGTRADCNYRRKPTRATQMSLQTPQQPSFLLATLKADSTTKTLPQRCLDLVKIIDECHAKELHPVFPWLVETVFGSLDGVLAGWNLRLLQARSNDYTAVMDFLKPSGPMMKLVYKLQAEDLKYEVPVSFLPAPVKACLQEGVLPDCPLFHNRLQFPLPGLPALNLALNPFEFYMFNFAFCLIVPKPLPQPGSSVSDSAYMKLLEMFLHYFLPIQGSVPPSPFQDPRGSVSTAPSPRSSSLHTPSSLLKHHIFHQPSANADPSAQEIWRSETLLQMLVEVWLHHYSLDMYQKLQSPQVKEPFSPTEEHVLAVRLLVKHLHCFSNSLREREEPRAEQHTHTHSSPMDEFKRVAVQRFVQQKLYLFLQQCFGHWPLNASFRAVLETWLSYIQPWRYCGDTSPSSQQVAEQRTVPDKWEPFVQENLLMYTKLFQGFLSRSLRTELLQSHNALTVLRVTKVFSHLNLAHFIQKAEQLFLEPEHVLHQHRQPRAAPSAGGAGSYLSPSGGSYLSPSYLSPRQRVMSDSVFRVKSHVYALEGQDCQYTQMFGAELRGSVMKLVQVVAQARHTATRMLEHSAAASSNSSSSGSLWWRLTAGLLDAKEAESEDGEQSLRKTGEMLERALENLCHIFKLNQAQVSQLVSGLDWSQDPGTSGQLPDCIQGENGLQLTELGRQQIISGLRRFDIQYQGDPELQPIRSFENGALVRLLYWLSCWINHQLHGPMVALCSRPDLLGRLGRYYLTAGDGAAAAARLASAPLVTRRYQQHQYQRQREQPRLSLRRLASYRTLLALLLLYLLAALLLSVGPASSTALILAGALLHGLFVVTLGDKLKTN
ncbi:sphingomyelin phosphodiesterase 4 isoform X2 [Nelusetta ayraudi]|uniref:sphingomyelin phosphodiesterase 4 isoform X2 n=1 Tax=Nelusetta ayraudi TaxID=303726 RepID=UPI003F7215EF